MTFIDNTNGREKLKMQIKDNKGKILGTLWTLAKGIIAIVTAQQYKEEEKYDIIRAPAPAVFEYLLKKSTDDLVEKDTAFKKLVSFVIKKYKELPSKNDKFSVIFNFKPPWFEELVEKTCKTIDRTLPIVKYDTEAT